MPQSRFKVTDRQTGKQYTINWDGANPPSDDDIDEMLGSQRTTSSYQPEEDTRDLGTQLSSPIEKKSGGIYDSGSVNDVTPIKTFKQEHPYINAASKFIQHPLDTTLPDNPDFNTKHPYIASGVKFAKDAGSRIEDMMPDRVGSSVGIDTKNLKPNFPTGVSSAASLFANQVFPEAGIADVPIQTFKDLRDKNYGGAAVNLAMMGTGAKELGRFLHEGVPVNKWSDFPTSANVARDLTVDGPVPSKVGTVRLPPVKPVEPWDFSSVYKPDNPNIVKVWRGVVGDVDAATPRKGYISTFSDNKNLADTYAGDSGSKPYSIDLTDKKLIEFPVRKAKYGKGNDFDKIAFDDAAKNLGPNEVLVARQVYDSGPRASLEKDPQRLFSYPSDIYATNSKIATKGHVEFQSPPIRNPRDYQSTEPLQTNLATGELPGRRQEQPIQYEDRPTIKLPKSVKVTGGKSKRVALTGKGEPDINVTVPNRLRPEATNVTVLDSLVPDRYKGSPELLPAPNEGFKPFNWESKGLPPIEPVKTLSPKLDTSVADNINIPKSVVPDVTPVGETAKPAVKTTPVKLIAKGMGSNEERLITPALTEAINKMAPEEMDALNKRLRKSNLTVIKDGDSYKVTSLSNKATSPGSLKDLVTGESGEFTPKDMWDNLKRLLGRDPTTEEVNSAINRQIKPGEQAGRVSQFPPNRGVEEPYKPVPGELGELQSFQMPHDSRSLKPTETGQLINTLKPTGYPELDNKIDRMKAIVNDPVLTVDSLEQLRQLGFDVSRDKRMPEGFRQAWRFTNSAYPEQRTFPPHPATTEYIRKNTVGPRELPSVEPISTEKPNISIGGAPLIKAKELTNIIDKPQSLIKKLITDDQGSTDISDIEAAIRKLAGKTSNVEGKIGPTGASGFMKQNPELRNAMIKWMNERAASEHIGLKTKDDFSSIIGHLSKDDLVPFQEDLAKGKYPEVRKFFDDQHAKMIMAGVPVDYKYNYLPQLWEESPEVVKNALGEKKLSTQAPFTQESVFKDYAQGKAAGLTPKMSPSEFIKWYAERSNKLIADTQMWDYLKENGLVKLKGVDGSQGLPTLNPDQMPGAFGTKGRNYVASPEIKYALENYLQGPSKDLAGKAGRFSGRAAGITLSGTVLPKTPLATGHGLNIVGSSYLEGGLKRVGKAIASGLPHSDASYNKYFSDNRDVTIEAVRKGLNIKNLDAAYKPLFDNPKNILSRTLNKVDSINYNNFRKPLFEQFIPKMMIEAYKDQISKGIDGGVAAETVNTAYGHQNLDTMFRDKHFQDIAKSILFAPSWLESRGRMLDVSKPAYRAAAGRALALYSAANIVNMVSSGKLMWQNPVGHEFDIAAGKTKEGKDRFISLSNAFDQYRIPTELVMDIAKKADLNELSDVALNKMSVPGKILSDILIRQEDRQGNPLITTSTDRFGNTVSLGKRLANTAGDISQTFSPPLVKAGINLATKGSPEEALTEAGQFPFRYKTLPKTKPQSMSIPMGNIKFPRPNQNNPIKP